MFRLAVVFACVSVGLAFTTSTRLNRVSQALNVKSKSVPFLDQPAALTGKLPGDVGFDPLGLSSLWADKDWSEQVVPNFWPDARSQPITTLDWMVDAEIKHSRLSMLAVLGWVAVELGLRLPGEIFSKIPNSLAAHDAAVSNGSMG